MICWQLEELSFIVKNETAAGQTSQMISIQGQLLGTVVGVITATQNAPASNDDGGYGSIPEALLKVYAHAFNDFSK